MHPPFLSSSYHYSISHKGENILTIRRTKISSLPLPPGCARCLALSQVQDLKRHSNSKNPLKSLTG